MPDEFKPLPAPQPRIDGTEKARYMNDLAALKSTPHWRYHPQGRQLNLYIKGEVRWIVSIDRPIDCAEIVRDVLPITDEVFATPQIVWALMRALCYYYPKGEAPDERYATPTVWE